MIMASVSSCAFLLRRAASTSRWPRSAFALLVAGLLLIPAARPWAHDLARAEAIAQRAPANAELGKLFDAVVERIAKSFWDNDRLAAVDWGKRAAEARQSVVEAPNLEEAARRINALLASLGTSHTGLLTPDDVDYYVLLDVFSEARGLKELVASGFQGEGVRYAGIGLFSVRIDGRDVVDAVLEGSLAERAGLKVGDEIVSVDGAAYHPVRSFRGKVGEEVAVAIRRARDGPTETVEVPVASIAPLQAFGSATLASARVIERDGRRIGYIHVWALVGDASRKAFAQSLARLGVNQSLGDKIDGLVIDMRVKIGGTGSNAGRYLDVLDPRGPLVRSRNKGAADHAGTAVRGRTAVLIDHHTRSTAELFVHSYKRERQGSLIGTRTAGAVSAAAAYAMPGGNLLYLAVAGLEIDGDVLEGPGVAPDIEVARPIPYSNGADPVLEAAVGLLARKAGLRTQPEQPLPSSN